MTEAHGSGKKGMRWLPFLLVLSLCAALLGCQVEVYRGLTEAQVNSWLVMASISALCLFLAHGLSSGIRCRRHLIAEWIVEKTDSLVH